MSWSSFRSVALAVAWRNVHNQYSHPMFFVPSLVFPLLFFTAFAGGLGRLASLPGFDFEPGYEAFQYVFVLLQTAAFGGVFTGFSIARDFETGFARRLMLAAASRPGIVGGYVIAGLTRWLTTAAVVTAVAFAAGMDVTGGVDVFGLYALALLLNMAITLFASGVAMRLRTMQAGPAMQTPVFLLLFLAPVYVPLDLLEGWVHAIATVNPVTRLLEAGRGFVSGELTEVAIAFGVVLALGAIFAVWARGGLRSAERAG
ncbi:MAG: ABC transporter permease [Thermoleophilia bacterium]